MGLVGSPELQRWYATHPDPDNPVARVEENGEEAEAITDGERADLLRLAEPWCDALERGDEDTAAEAWLEIEARAGAGGPLRDLAEKMRLEVMRHV